MWHRFFAYTDRARPGLHVWREGTSVRFSLRPVQPVTQPGWIEFRCSLNALSPHPVRFMLFSFRENGAPGEFEKDDFQRQLPRLDSGVLAESVWFAEGTGRVVVHDPRVHARTSLRVHLISQRRFRPSEMFLWDPVTGAQRRVPQADADALGPIFDLNLAPHEQSFFNFKFVARKDGQFEEFESDYANRWWTADDGGEIWTHSSTAAIARAVPQTCTLTMQYRQEFSSPATMHLWAENGDYGCDVAGEPQADGWTAFRTQVFAHLPYGCLFYNPELPPADRWEHAEAKRTSLTLAGDTQWWTLEGDRTLFPSPPARTAQLDLIVANRVLSSLEGSLLAHVWVNRARGPIAREVPVDPEGRVSLSLYPQVTTSIKFHDRDGHWERLDRHPVGVASGESPARRYVVLERSPLLKASPPGDLIADPPFTIRRPGAYAEDGEMRFVVHAPQVADLQLIGEWTDWQARPVQMRSTHDGAYWWGHVKIADVLAGLPAGQGDYHGANYQFLINQQQRLQDPAAAWVVDSDTDSTSRLVRHERFSWHDQQWRRPGWESLVIYQLHPSRFTNRFTDDPPLRRVTREIAENSGYFRELGVTAIQLMPVNEVGTSNSWGYDPAYFYAIENDYCGPEGPDELKRLVDTCHQHGLAVFLDVVFNHAGGDDNILWHVARESFFDGDTRWGAMINFDHPQCRHFFAQNLVYLANEFHIDGFRLDHTATIVHSAAWDSWSSFVRELGSGGGWEFLHGLRHAVVSQVDGRCILMAEHLPNEWSLTNHGGPMDSQWCDDFHDRLVDACRRQFGLSRLADALQISRLHCDDWYKVVNYPESHDEVGNVRDRIAFVAGYGQGWRMSKVAAAATLLSRGIPLYFMGAESAEDQQFAFGSEGTLDVAGYLASEDRGRIRAWWRELGRLRRDASIQGPAPLEMRHSSDQLLTFTRGQNADFFVLLNFGGWTGTKRLSELNLPGGEYRELWNSSWPAFAIRAEQELERTNGGRMARLDRDHLLQIPAYAAIILQRR